jgi:tetratricopeptide (TPR) repeat protein
VERYPNYATAWALLSLTYLDELRFRYRLNPPSPPPLELAAQAARRSVELDPQNVRGLEAEMLSFYFRGDVAAALDRGARAFAINPNDTELLGEYGFRLALSGQWEQGCRYAADAVARNPGPLGYFEVALAVCAYMRRDYAAAEEWATSADLQSNPIYHIVVTAILGQLGKAAEAEKERQWMEANAPEFLGNIRREVALRVLRPEDQASILDGLKKAGVVVPES